MPLPPRWATGCRPSSAARRWRFWRRWLPADGCRRAKPQPVTAREPLRRRAPPFAEVRKAPRPPGASEMPQKSTEADTTKVRGIIGETAPQRSEEHTSELQSQSNLVCRLLLEKKKKTHMGNSEMDDVRKQASTGVAGSC